MSHKYIIGLLQEALNKELGAGLKVDYMQGKKTFSACPTLNTSCKDKWPETIEAYQLLLEDAGYLTSGSDGWFGNGCKKDTKKYQSAVVGMRNPDGEATRMRKTWSHLLRLS